MSSASENDPGACARCATRFSTCCVISPRDVTCCFPLSEAEADVIHTYLPAKERGIALVREKNSPDFLKAMHQLFPGEHGTIASLFALGAEHWRFGTDERGACHMLTPSGCSLPREVRPPYCHLFPFWVVRGQLSHFKISSCQAQREQFNRENLIASFDMNEPLIFELYNALRHGWGLPKENRRPSGLPPDLRSRLS